MNNIAKYPDDDMVVITGPSPQKMREEDRELAVKVYEARLKEKEEN